MFNAPFSQDDLFYRHMRADWIDDNGKPKAASCQIDQFKKGLSCDWARTRTPAETVFGTGSEAVLEIIMKECVGLGMTIKYWPTNDKYRPGKINYAHCMIFMPAGMSRAQMANLRDLLLDRFRVRDCRPSALHAFRELIGRLDSMRRVRCAVRKVLWMDYAKISAPDALEIARQEFVALGWSMDYPIKVEERLKSYRISTRTNATPCGPWVEVNVHSGAIIKTVS